MSTASKKAQALLLQSDLLQQSLQPLEGIISRAERVNAEPLIKSQLLNYMEHVHHLYGSLGVGIIDLNEEIQTFF